MNLILLPLIFVAVPSALASLQGIRVTGKFTCGDKPYSNGTAVKLVELNPINDDTLDKKKVEDDGSFTVQGQKKEVSDIDPELHIYTWCATTWALCPRRWKIKIPKSYIYDPNGNKKETSKTFNLGTVNLEAILRNEDHDCFH